VKLQISDTFNKELPADPIQDRESRIVEKSCFSFVHPTIPSRPELIHYSSDMATTLGLEINNIESTEFLNLVSGKFIYPQTKPYAMCYGGHQFGQWAGQLGDGRAINLFETIHQDKRWAWQLKGAGKTPYSRNADGLAVLRSSIREYLCSEAMHCLGVPTTRALSLSLTGDKVMRDMLYNGNPQLEKGAIVCRISPSFIRFGNFEILAARKDYHLLKTLADYTIRHFFPSINIEEPNAYLYFFSEVSRLTLEMMLHWYRIGFVHGVMNTDNMSILGLTIDYGPFGWIDDYNPHWTPNTTDAENGRYRFENQAQVALWNLVQLANALYPLIENIPALEEILNEYQTQWEVKYNQVLFQKLGIKQQNQAANQFVQSIDSILQLTETDMTIFYRLLADIKIEMTPEEALAVIENSFYRSEELVEIIRGKWLQWLSQYLEILKVEKSNDSIRSKEMNQINPKYVLRNYMSQLAIEAAEIGNYDLIHELYTLIQNPYSEQPEYEKWFAKRPESARNKLGSSTLSCSS